jgi:hypothetical protein
MDFLKATLLETARLKQYAGDLLQCRRASSGVAESPEIGITGICPPVCRILDSMRGWLVARQEALDRENRAVNYCVLRGRSAGFPWRNRLALPRALDAGSAVRTRTVA